VLLALNYAQPGGLQYWLGYMKIHVVLFFHNDETTTHLPHIMQQSMHYSYIESQKPAVTSCSNDQHWDQTGDGPDSR